MMRWLICLMGMALFAQRVEDTFSRDPGPFDLLKGESFEQIVMQNLAADALVGISSEGKLVPRLGTRWEVKGNNVKVFLRQGVRFSDGQTVTSDDVVWTYRTLQQDPGASPSKKAILREVDVQGGPGWVKLTSPKPPMRLLLELARVAIARKGHREIGSGPYLMTRQGDQWLFTRRDHFLRPSLPEMRFQLSGDEYAELSALRKGWRSLGVPPSQPGLMPPPTHQEVRQEMLAQTLVFSRIGPEPLKAIEGWRSSAFPDRLMAPKARASRGVLPEGFGFKPRPMGGPPFKPAGQRWEILYGASDTMLAKALMALRARAAKDGVTLDLRPIEDALFIERVIKGDFTLACLLQVFDPHPWSILELMEPGAPLNLGGWTHPKLGSILERLRQPGDPAWEELHQIWAERPLALPIFDRTSVLWVDRRLEVQPSPVGLYLTTPGPAGWRWRGAP